MKARLIFLNSIPFLVAILAGCNGSASADIHASASSLPPFDIAITAPTVTGTMATHFDLSANIVGSKVTVANPSFVWDFGGERPTVTGTHVQVDYTEPGLHLVSVTADDGMGHAVTSGILLSVAASNSKPSLLGITMGDINNDGQTDQSDLTLLQTHIYGTQHLSTSRSMMAGDIDQDGALSSRDVDLLQQMISRGISWPSALTLTKGMPGAKVTILSKELLDLEAEASIYFEVSGSSTRELTPFRAVSGYATFFIPLDIAGKEPSAILVQTINICLMVHGVRVECLPFELVPSAPMSGVPGEKLRNALASMGDTLDTLQYNMNGHLNNINATPEETDLHMATLALAKERLLLGSQELTTLFNRLDDKTLTNLEQIALANGLPKDMSTSRFQQPLVSANETCPSTPATIYNHVFAFKQGLTSILEPTVDAFADVCASMTFASLGMPELAPVALACNVQSAQMGAAVSLASAVADFMPGLDSNLTVVSSKPLLSPGESATISVKASYSALRDICSASAGVLTDRLTEKLVKKLSRSIGLFRVAYHVIKYAPLDERGHLRSSVLDQLNQFMKHRIFDAFALDQLVSSAKDKICSSLPPGEPFFEIPVCALNEFVMQSDSGALGFLTPGLQTGTYTASQECQKNNSVRILAKYRLASLSTSGSVDITQTCKKHYTGSVTLSGSTITSSNSSSFCSWTESWSLVIDLWTGEELSAEVHGVANEIVDGWCSASGTSPVEFAIPLSMTGSSISGINTHVVNCFKARLALLRHRQRRRGSEQPKAGRAG